MLIDSYKQESNYKRKYKLININEGIDLIPFIKNRDLSYSKFEQEKDGSMSANSMSFTLTFPYNSNNISVTSSSPMMIDAELLKNYMIDLNEFIGLEEPKITSQISLGKLIKKGDNIVLFEETENNLLVFDGISEAPKIKRDKMHIYLTIEVKDKTYSLYEMKHLKEEFFQDIYLCNTLNKSNSLVHQVAYRLGFKDEELDLPNFNTIIPFVLFKKDELIIKELAYAVRLVGGVFSIENGKLVVRAEANRVTETYVFDSRNILSEINIDPIYPNYDKLKITYDYYFEKDLQDMWILVGENGNLSDANIVVRAGQDRKFSVDWLYNVDLVKNYELYDVEFTDIYGNLINFDYTLDIDETGGALELNNTGNNYDIYVKKFKIRGIPLFMQEGNETYYPANIDSEKLLDNLENKLVQNSSLALLYLKANYNENCKIYKSLNFTTNINNYLEPCRKVYLNHVDFTGYIIIEKIDFQGVKMSVQAREYLEPVNINDIKTLEKSSVDEYEVISNKFLTEKGLYEADLPLSPQNLVLISQALGFTITFDNFSSNLRGHFVYLKKKTDVDWMKFFINNNNHFYQTTNLVTYEIKVSSVSINGVEGETSEVKEVTPILLNNGVVDYPEGLSPIELDTKVANINNEVDLHKTDIEDIKDVNAFQAEKLILIEDENIIHSEKIELIEEDIVSMKKKDSDNYTAITQNTEQIQNIAQEVETKTDENQVQIITNTAIESFSANEFRRTLGTKVSIIDYSKNIDDIQTIDIDSDELKETLIEDVYSSIYQNSREILSVVKTTEEQYSAIQQLVNQITLLVQEDSNTYSLIQQLSDHITLLVKSDDDNFTLIEQTNEKIQSVVERTTNSENNIFNQTTQITQNTEQIQNIAQEVETKTDENQVQTITNTAIESFSANEFRRTLGTKVSIIDYSKNIDDVQTIDIDSDELKETHIEDVYSSIYQNSREILNLIKTSDEHYSSILQLVESITFLVQENSDAKSIINQLSNEIDLLVQSNSENYSLIEQLTDELTFAVKKDDIVSTINQTAEEIKINAKRIALGSGLIVENEQVVVREIGAEHIRANAITSEKIEAGAITGEKISGKRLEGIEIISENETQTERVYITSGQVVHEKRNSISEIYKSYEKLSMMYSGEVTCANNWSENIDLKLYNNGLSWSNLNVLAFITAQYDLNTNGIATSNYIQKEWVGDPSDNIIRFRVAGSGIVTNTNDFSTYTFSSNLLTISNLKGLNISMVFSLPVTKFRGSYYDYSGDGHATLAYDYIYLLGYVNIYLKLDASSEILVGTVGSYGQVGTSGSKTFLWNSSYATVALTGKLRYEFVYCTDTNIVKNMGYISAIIDSYTNSGSLSSKSGSITTTTNVTGVIYNANVQWLAIGNS